MRRNAKLPLPPIEMEQGEAVKATTQQAHPFTIAPKLPSALKEAVKFWNSLVADIRSFRITRMEEFEQAARDDFPGIIKEIEGIKDQPLKNFMLKEVPKGQQHEKKVVKDVLLWDYLYGHSCSQNANFMTSVRKGFPFVRVRSGFLSRCGGYRAIHSLPIVMDTPCTVDVLPGPTGVF